MREFPLRHVLRRATWRAQAMTSFVIVIRIRYWCFVVQKERCPERRRNRPERTWRLGKVKKTGEVIGSACIGEGQCTLRNAKIMLHETDDTAEVMAVVIDVTGRSKSGNHNQRHAKTKLVPPLRRSQDGRRLMIIPASPVVPGNEDSGSVPI